MVPWLVVAMDVCVRMSLRRLECKSANLVMLGGVSLSFSVFGPSGSKSPYGWVCIGEYYVEGIVSFYHVASKCVCFVIVCDSRV